MKGASLSELDRANSGETFPVKLGCISIKKTVGDRSERQKKTGRDEAKARPFPF